jgi:hypothetical protein
MTTICRAFETEQDARAAVDRVLSAGTTATDIRVLMGEALADHADAPVGAFAGEAMAVGTFADRELTTHDGMGSFAGDPTSVRTGGFGDIDRETLTTYEDGVKRVRIASHRDLRRMLVDAGLDDRTAAADVDALHHGRVLVLVRADPAADAADALDATSV